MRKLLVIAAAAASIISGAATAVPFDITGGGYTLGTGFGCPTNNADTQLCVASNYTLGNPAPFTLANAGDSVLLTFGTFTLRDDNNSLSGGEQDNLNLTAYLDFTDPFAGTTSRIATTGSVNGEFGDAAVDLSFTFAPITVAFGNGGQFTVLFDSMFFAANPQTVTQNVRVTLDSASTAVPEPAMLGLFGLGAIGIAFARRRRAA